MIACSIYNRKGVVHRWTPSAERDWRDMMHSNCGLFERRVHLDEEVVDAFPRCKKCFPPKGK